MKFLRVHLGCHRTLIILIYRALASTFQEIVRALSADLLAIGVAAHRHQPLHLLLLQKHSKRIIPILHIYGFFYVNC